MENDGYEAIQVGFKDSKAKKVNKPAKGHFDKAGVAAEEIPERIQTGRHKRLRSWC